jgi:hypothetical protein
MVLIDIQWKGRGIIFMYFVQDVRPMKAVDCSQSLYFRLRHFGLYSSGSR